MLTVVSAVFLYFLFAPSQRPLSYWRASDWSASDWGMTQPQPVVRTAQVARGLASTSAIGFPSPFYKQKLVLSPRRLAQLPGFSGQMQKLYKSSSMQDLQTVGLVLPRKMPLAVIIDNECLAAQINTELASDFLLKVVEQQESIPTLDLQTYVLRLPDDLTLAEVESLLRHEDCIRGAGEQVVERLVSQDHHDDPLYLNQPSLTTIHADEGFDFFYAGEFAISDAVTIAVVDTGINYQHEDLNAHMWSNLKGEYGYDFYNGDNDPLDDNGHGTHVSGIAAAVSSNVKGMTGIMGFHAQLMAIKVLHSDGTGYTSDVSNGIYWAVSNGAEIINLSLGGEGTSAVLQESILFAVSQGVMVIMAAGNNGLEITSDVFYSPAGYAKDIEGAMAVGSISYSSETKSSFSNYSTSYIEIAAPGSPSILSTYFPGSAMYTYLAGTSMAAPAVTGAAALTVGWLKSNGMVWSPSLVEHLLTHGSRVNPNLTNYFKQGRQLDLRQLSELLKASVLYGFDGGVDADF